MIPRVPRIVRSILALPFLAIGAVGINMAEWISPELFGHAIRDPEKEPRS